MRRTINLLVNLGEDVLQKKFSVGFLLDLSGSMQGPPLEQTKIAINNLLRPDDAGGNILSLADQVNIVTFHTTVQKICPWVNKEDFDFFREFLFGVPDMADVIMKDSGATALFDGMAEILISCYKEAKVENERIILIFSDGCNYGDERFTKKDVKALVEKQNYGFILKADALEIKNQNEKGFNQLLEDLHEKDYYLFKQGTTEANICSLITETQHQQILIKAFNSSKKPARICSLYYREPSASDRGLEILQEFATLTGGVVFDAPTPESIPNVMQELFHRLEYGENSSIRTGLISRLKENPVSGNTDWFRVFSINSTTEEKGFKNENGHTIFNTRQENCRTRNEALESFKRDYINSSQDGELSKILIPNFHNQGLTFGTNIQTNPFVYFVFRGNDTLGTSLFQTVSKILDSIRNDPMDILGTPHSDYHAFLVILIDNLINYTIEDKKKLSALFNEINLSDPDYDRVHGIYILSERNDHFKANPDGYKNLSKTEFEQMVVENLVSLNVNQQLVVQAYLETHAGRTRENAYDRFLSIGNVSLFADKQQFADKVSFKLCHDLLLNLYDEDFKTDIDAVNREVDNYMADLSFSALRNNVLQGDNGLNLLTQIDCPSALESGFLSSWKSIVLTYTDQIGLSNHPLTRIVHNRSFIEFIQYLYFDVRNYVESCNTLGTFNSIVQNKIDALLESKTSQLQAITERLIYNGHLSSPKQAELWIENLSKRLKNYIDVNFAYDYNNDPVYREYSNFSYKTLGLDITDDNPATPLDRLKEKLENFPLPIASRFKYYSLAGLFAAGSLVFFYNGIIPIEGLLSLIIPILTVIWGEYRIGQNMKQLRKLINWYGMAHRQRSRRQALEFLRTRLNQMLIELKDKIKREDETITPDKLYTENLTEQDYLDLFRKSLTESLPCYFQYESKAAQGISNFHIDLTKGFYDWNKGHVDLIDEKNINKLAGLDKISWNGFYYNLLNTKDTISEYSFPTIKLTFLPPDFTGLLSNASAKPGINLLLKVQYKEIIKDRRYYLTLLDKLNNQEIAELKGFFNHKTWHEKIDILVNMFTDVKPVSDVNFFSLWRRVCYYQVWLNEVGRIIKNDESGKEIIKSENIFELWEKMYLARKEFREKLLQNSNQILAFNVDNALHIWNIIQQSANKDKLIKHVKNWSFSPVHLANAHHAYPSYAKQNYLAEQKYLSGSLKPMMQKDLSSLLEDSKFWNEIESQKGNNLTFNHYVVIPFEDLSLLKNLSDILISPDFVDKDKGSWREYFLDEFCEKYLKTRKQRKEFKWLFTTN
jgi:hypothetical protein